MGDIKMGKRIGIAFSVSGTCYQTIELNDDCTYTPDEVLEMLNSGDAITSVQEGGDLVIIGGAEWNVIGEVTQAAMDSEYSDFELGD